MGATYIYCVIKTKGPAKLGRAPRGLDGTEKPRLLDVAGPYRAIAAVAPLDLYGTEAIERRLRDLAWVGSCAAAHEAIVEHAAKLGTVVPMKLFTLFSDDARAAASLKEMKPALERVVERIAGCDEWGVRVLQSDKPAKRAAPPRATSGRGFLERKKALDDEKRAFTEGAVAEVDDLYLALGKLVRRAERRPAPPAIAGRVLLDAVFLVPRTAAKKLTHVVSLAGKSLAARGFAVSLTGPWPAYSFVAEQKKRR